MNCPTCKNDTLTHHSHYEDGRRWITSRCFTCGYVDSYVDPSPPGPEAPLACPRCSKSIRPGSGKLLPTGKTVHVRCPARDSQNRPVGFQAEFQAVGEAATDVAQRSRSLTDHTPCVRLCAACGKSLSAGGGLLFQGDRLVHALCWDPGLSPSSHKDSTPR